MNSPEGLCSRGHEWAVHGRIPKRNKKQWECAECQRALQREWHKANPEKGANTKLKIRYGITLEQKRQMLADQLGCCAICATADFGKKGPVVDHNHETGKVRGILCDPCNKGLGHFRDDPARLRAAIEYLEGVRA